MSQNKVKTTKTMLNELSDIEFITKEQAAELANVALKQYTRRSKEGKRVDSAVYDMSLAGGCPNAVYNAVEKLVNRYEA